MAALRVCRARALVFLALALVASVPVVGSASNASDAYCAKLGNIQTTVGVWDKPFDRDVFNYEISLGPSADSVIIQCFVDFTAYSGEEDWPIITINGTEMGYSESEPASYTVELKRSPFVLRTGIFIGVEGPPSKLDHLDELTQELYVLNFERAADLEHLLAMKALTVYDDQDRTIALRPPFKAKSAVRSYEAFVQPDVEKIHVHPFCASGSVAELGGSPIKPDSSTWVKMNRQATHTVVHTACVYGGDRRSVVIKLQVVVDIDDVADNLQLRVVGDEGFVTRVSKSAFQIQATSEVVQFVPVYANSHVALTLEIAGREDTALFIGMPTPPLRIPAHRNLTVILMLRSGEDSRRLVVTLKRYVATTLPPQLLHSAQAGAAGSFVAVTVWTCLGASALVASTSAIIGLGATRGHAMTVVFRSLTFFLQFLALNNVVHGGCPFTDFAQPLLTLNLFSSRDQYADDGVALRLGAVEAAQCLLGSLVALAAAGVAHLLLLLLRLLVGGCQYTLPHQLRFGCWEVHCLLHLLYPMSCAATVLLSSSPPTPETAERAGMLRYFPNFWWCGGAAAALLGPLLLALVSACRVRRALRLKRVTWIARHSKTAGREGTYSQHAENGYFCDVSCDQLGTRPVEHSFCHRALPLLRWSATVADIRPVKLCVPAGRGAKSDGEAEYLPVDGDDRYASDDDDSDSERDVNAARHVSFAGDSAEVEVVSTVQLGAAHRQVCCAEAGRFSNVPWLEALLSAEALLRLHHEVEPQLHDWATPLRVRAEQLQGPITSGFLSFCFEGLRWPQLPALEIALRVALGAFTAVVILDPTFRPLALGVSALLAGLTFSFLLHEAPCAAAADNALLLLGHLGVVLVALSFLANSAGIFRADVCSAVLLLIVAGVMPPLLLYTVLATIAQVSAFACPLGFKEQAESHTPCNVDLALRGPNSAWLLLVPAQCSVPVSDAFVHALPTGAGDAQVYVTKNFVRGSKPRLEFPVLDYLAPTDQLEPPLLVLFGYSRDSSAAAIASYRSECVYVDEDPWGIALEFAKRGPAASVPYAPEIAREVLELARERAKPGRILAVGIVPVPAMEAVRREDLSENELDEEDLGVDSEETEPLNASARGWR